MNGDLLAEKIVEHRARAHPAWATSAGIRGHDHRLRDPSAAAYAAEASALRDLLREAEALDPGVPRDALVTTISVELFDITEARTFARDPDVAAELFDHILATMLASHLSPDEKAASIVARVAAGPAFLATARARFDAADVPALWVHGALQTMEGASAFLDAARELAPESDVDALAVALAEHKRWLADLHARAKGSPALGREKFERLLKLRRIRESPAELEAMGERLRERFAREMDEAARTVLAEAGKRARDDPLADALAIVRAEHATSFGGVLADYARSIDDARAFVTSHGLATPTSVPLDVMETPGFLRHLIPFAAYIGPARFATPRRGVYLVTPKADLSAFPRADIVTTTVHEAWPGHHLQLSIAAERAPLWAWLVDAVDLVEGWALYCEATMGAHGFTARPAERLIRAKDARWRAVRIVLDVGLHARGLSPEEAARILARETSMSAEEADAEVLRYTKSPAYNLSYMLGCMGLLALKEKWLSSGGSEPGFHDAVLAAGPLPISLLERTIAPPNDAKGHPTGLSAR